MRLVSRNFFLGLLLLLSLDSPALATDKQTLPTLATPFAAVDFELDGEDGRTYRLSDYRGQVVLINFWATWCPPCRYEMPSLERLWQQVKGKGVVILAINVGEDEDTIFEFMGQYPMTFPLPMDQDGKVIKAYPVMGLPTSYIISPQGQVTHRAVGSREWDDAGLIEQLMSMRK
ncbi:TlpA disulfide reductase family protein [Sulfuriflexus sp.]|uniref:TlpA family protein disulfide reductase n=1 Tax=Sulfuriflexus sp. TaxID=2015443 RepID=UPI0028CEEA9B|nr:TlpA disulfide reductase family protein [Sulfuriflexus sp.]MDT8404810.1 TlpA disulfide reductase family protein [Sulfuriflexus sp.]